MDDQKAIAELGGYELWGQGTPALIFWGVSMLMICCSAIFVINEDYGTFILCFFGAGMPYFIFYLFDKSYFEKCYQKGLEIELEKEEIDEYKPIAHTAQYEEKKEAWIKLASKEWEVPKSDVEAYFYSLETEGKAWWLNRKGRHGSTPFCDIFKETKISYLVSKQDWNALVGLKAVEEIIKVINILLNNEAIFEEDRAQVWRSWHSRPHPDAEDVMTGRDVESEAAYEIIIKKQENDKRGNRIFEALGKIGDTKAMNYLIECLQNKDETVRLAATRGLGKTRNDSAIEPLIKALEDEEKSVRKSAVNALDEMGWKIENE